MEYTKGEWRAEQGRGGDFNVFAGDFRPTVICNTRQDISKLDYDEMKANANLIAAAPDMYKALKELVGILDTEEGRQETDSYTSQPAREALAKAEGK